MLSFAIVAKNMIVSGHCIIYHSYLKHRYILFKKYIVLIYMENKEVEKKGRGRPKILTDKERTNNKTKYMLNKPWFCDVCMTSRNYTLAGKFCHLKSSSWKELLI